MAEEHQGAPDRMLMDALAIVLASSMRDGPYFPDVGAIEARARAIVRQHADIVIKRLLDAQGRPDA